MAFFMFKHCICEFPTNPAALRLRCYCYFRFNNWDIFQEMPFRDIVRSWLALCMICSRSVAMISLEGHGHRLMTFVGTVSHVAALPERRIYQMNQDNCRTKRNLANSRDQSVDPSRLIIHSHRPRCCPSSIAAVSLRLILPRS